MSATASMVNDFSFEEGEVAVRGVPDHVWNATDGSEHSKKYGQTRFSGDSPL